MGRVAFEILPVRNFVSSPWRGQDKGSIAWCSLFKMILAVATRHSIRGVRGKRKRAVRRRCRQHSQSERLSEISSEFLGIVLFGARFISLQHMPPKCALIDSPAFSSTFKY